MKRRPKPLSIPSLDLKLLLHLNNFAMRLIFCYLINILIGSRGLLLEQHAQFGNHENICNILIVDILIRKSFNYFSKYYANHKLKIDCGDIISLKINPNHLILMIRWLRKTNF